MRVYEKPLLSFESLFVNEKIASDNIDPSSLGELDTIDYGEVSIGVPDSWLDY